MLVSSLVVEAGTTGPSPYVQTGPSPLRSPTAATTCRPRSGSSRPGARAAATAAGSTCPRCAGGTTDETGAGSVHGGSATPAGGAIAAGSDPGSTDSQGR